MRPRPSWRFWLLVLAAGATQGGVALVLFVGTRLWVGPAYLLVALVVTLGLSRERSLQAMAERRRRGWALAGGLLAIAISSVVGLVAFVVALAVACQDGC